MKVFSLKNGDGTLFLMLSCLPASSPTTLPDSYYDQGISLMKQKNFKDAIEVFHMSVGMAATDASIYETW